MIRIVIAEDQGMVRGALAALLNLEDDLEVIAEAGNGREAWQIIQEQKPDVCLLDIEMPEMSGLHVAEEVKKASLPCRVMMLTTFARPGYLQRALQAGVHGYLLKDAPIDQLASSIRDVHAGRRAISPELALTMWDESSPLTERDREILALVSEGLKTAEIAARLFLSEGTVRNYTSEILHKLNAKNRIEAVNVANAKGWL